MTSDLSEVYDFIFSLDGQKIVKPEFCDSCIFIKETYQDYLYRVCNVCGHLYLVSNITTEKEVGCWCRCLLKRGYIKKLEDYKEFYKKCLLDSIPRLERVGITCNSCKCKKECEDGGTNTKEIITVIGCCEDIIL